MALSKHSKYLLCLFLCFHLINNFYKSIYSKFSINTLKTLTVWAVNLNYNMYPTSYDITKCQILNMVWYYKMHTEDYVTLSTRNDKADLTSIEHTNILHKTIEIFVCLIVFHFAFINICICIVILNFILKATIWVAYLKSID